MTNESALTMVEHAIEHLRQSDAYWHNEDYLPTERAINTLFEAHKAVGPLGQIPSWEQDSPLDCFDPVPSVLTRHLRGE